MRSRPFTPGGWASLGLKPIDVAAGQATAATVLLAPLALSIDKPWTLPLPSGQVVASVLAIAAFSTALAFIVYFRILAGAGRQTCCWSPF